MRRPTEHPARAGALCPTYPKGCGLRALRGVGLEWL